MFKYFIDIIGFIIYEYNILKINNMKKLSSHHKNRQKDLLNDRKLLPYYRPELYHLPQYQATPNLQSIFHHGGKCQNLRLSNQYGSIFWEGFTNLNTLQQPLINTLSISDLQVQVYLDDKGKPSQHHQLNKQCLVSFTTKTPFQQNSIKKKCQEYQLQLLSVNPEEGFVGLRVFHFTKYSFNVENNSTKSSQSETQVLPAKGLKKSLFKESFKQQKRQSVPNNSKKQALFIESFRQTKKDIQQCQNFDAQAFYNTIFWQQELNQQTISRLITDNNCLLEMKRLLSLYNILFYPSTLFEFEKENNLLIFRQLESSKHLDHETRHIYMKNWFQWVIQNFYQIKTKNKILEGLLTRKISSCFNFLMINSRHQQAQVMMAIQDKQFRKKLCKSKQFYGSIFSQLSEEVKLILKGRIDLIVKLDLPWLMQLALISWYFMDHSFEENCHMFLKRIESDIPIVKAQFRLFYLYVAKQHHEKACCLRFMKIEVRLLREYEFYEFWWLENKLEQIKNLIKQLCLKYKDIYKDYYQYRYQLLQAFLINCQQKKRTFRQIDILTKQDSFLQQSDKDKILVEIVGQSNYLPESYQIRQMKGVLKNRFLESKALNLYSSKCYLDSLKLLCQIDESWNHQCRFYANEIVNKSSFITNYKINARIQLLNILNNKKEQFEYHIQLLKVFCGIIDFNDTHFDFICDLLELKLKTNIKIYKETASYFKWFIKVKILEDRSTKWTSKYKNKIQLINRLQTIFKGSLLDEQLIKCIKLIELSS